MGVQSWTSPVRVHRSLRSHLLYWNTTRDQSEGLFRGLSWNPYLPEGSKVGPPQSECIARFTHTFSIGTPRATSPRGCFKGLVQTLICQRGPKLDLPSLSASLASLAPSLLEHHARPVRGVVSRAYFKPLFAGGVQSWTSPVRVHRSHLLYWNTTRDQSKGLFRGLSSNPNYSCDQCLVLK